MEQWKDIIGYEGLYQVSNLGRVRNIQSGRVLKNEYNSVGYLRAGLTKQKKQKHLLVHRLVAKAFIPNPDNLPEVNHKDENKANNCVDNLEWCNRVYNNEYGMHNKKISNALTNHPSTSKMVLCVELNRAFVSTQDAGRFLKNKYAHSNISSCCNGKIKTAYGYHWQYI